MFDVRKSHIFNADQCKNTNNDDKKTIKRPTYKNLDGKSA